uniref:Uncharacterized protein n=1 Tax=Mycena chlorophos TaxID=658473 RepID=A0ABQ0L8K8_MYCCL|nr:predicted protein [Mycena chlorophos]
MTAEELKEFGVDWGAVHDENVLESRQNNNGDSEGTSSWIHSGPPDHLNEINLSPPTGPFSPVEMGMFTASISEILHLDDVSELWRVALAAASSLRPDLF